MDTDSLTFSGVPSAWETCRNARTRSEPANLPALSTKLRYCDWTRWYFFAKGVPNNSAAAANEPCDQRQSASGLFIGCRAKSRGGGTLDGLKLEHDQKAGADIVRRAIESPLRWIAQNAGVT